MFVVRKRPCLKLWWSKRSESDNAWKVNIANIVSLDKEGGLLNVNLDIKNPSRKGDLEYRHPDELLESIVNREKKIMLLVSEIEAIVQGSAVNNE